LLTAPPFAALQGGAIFAKSLQSLPSGQGLVKILNTRIVNNTSSFGAGVACWDCRAVILNTSIVGNVAIHTLPAWVWVNNEMIGSKNHNLDLHVKGVGGAVAAAFESSKTFVYIDQDSTIEGNRAQTVGGAIYVYKKEGSCDDNMGPAVEAGLPSNAVKLCGVSLSAVMHTGMVHTKRTLLWEGGTLWLGGVKLLIKRAAVTARS
jgi:hypothetical protein